MEPMPITAKNPENRHSSELSRYHRLCPSGYHGCLLPALGSSEECFGTLLNLFRSTSLSVHLLPYADHRFPLDQYHTRWERYVGIDGARIGMRTFGESAPLQKKLMQKFGFTVDAVVQAALEQVNKAKQ
jgi:hypothetical protein